MSTFKVSATIMAIDAIWRIFRSEKLAHNKFIFFVIKKPQNMLKNSKARIVAIWPQSKNQGHSLYNLDIHVSDFVNVSIIKKNEAIDFRSILTKNSRTANLFFRTKNVLHKSKVWDTIIIAKL